MQKWILSILLFSFLSGAPGDLREEISADVNPLTSSAEGVTFDSESTIARTYAADIENDVWRTYYEMSDGTWRTDEHTYQYRLEITGRLANAACDTTYIYLSNREDITFEQAWLASGLSSDLNDYFDEKDAVLVSVKLSERKYY